MAGQYLGLLPLSFHQCQQTRLSACVFQLGAAGVRLCDPDGDIRHDQSSQVAIVRSGRLDVRGLLALRTLANVEAHLLVFQKRLESLDANLREMREELFAAVVGGDEAETLRVVEPLHSSCWHSRLPCLNANGSTHSMHAEVSSRRLSEAPTFSPGHLVEFGFYDARPHHA